MKEKTCFSVNGTYLMLDSFTVLNLIFCRIHYIFMEIRNTWLQTFIMNSKKYCEKKLMFASFSFILQLWNEKIWNTFNQKRNFELRTENFELNFFRRPFESSCSWFTFVFWSFRRPWYHRALVNPSKTAVSNAYMDANGIGKVITISEAVFQALPKNASDISCDSLENIRGGCPCKRHVFKRPT